MWLIKGRSRSRGKIPAWIVFMEALRRAKIEYYERMGGDRELAVPTRDRLEQLGIGWVADRLARYGRLPE